MHLSYREWWALIHGIIFGAFFLLGIAVFCMGLVTTLAEASTGIADGRRP